MSPVSRMAAASLARRSRGFTLLELMVVVALIAGLAVFMIGRIAGAGSAESASLRSAQATLANLLTAARTRAMASGRDVRILLHITPTGSLAADRYLRYLVLQTYDGANWTTVSEAFLPSGVYVVPRDPTAVTGLIPAVANWTRPSDGMTLRSTALRANTTSFPDAEVTVAINSTNAETWAAIKFTPAGTTINSSDMIVGSGRASPENASSPVQFISPDAVRGVTISSYGVPALINGREGF